MSNFASFVSFQNIFTVVVNKEAGDILQTRVLSVCIQASHPESFKHGCQPPLCITTSLTAS